MTMNGMEDVRLECSNPEFDERTKSLAVSAAERVLAEKGLLLSRCLRLISGGEADPQSMADLAAAYDAAQRVVDQRASGVDVRLRLVVG